MLKPWCIQKHWRMLKPWGMLKPWRIQKHWRMQKYWRMEKTRRLPMLAQQEKVGRDAEELPYCYARQTLQQLTSLRPRDGLVLLLADLLIRVHVVSKWGGISLCPAFMGRLSPVLYRLVYTGLPCSKWWKLCRLPNLWRPPKISLILVKLSLHKASYQKTEKTLMLNITVQYQSSYSQPPN